MIGQLLNNCKKKRHNWSVGNSLIDTWMGRPSLYHSTRSRGSPTGTSLASKWAGMPSTSCTSRMEQVKTGAWVVKPSSWVWVTRGCSRYWIYKQNLTLFFFCLRILIVFLRIQFKNIALGIWKMASLVIWEFIFVYWLIEIQFNVL